MKYEVIRTDTADSLIRKIILYVAENFGDDVALEKLDYLEEAIMNLGIIRILALGRNTMF